MCAGRQESCGGWKEKGVQVSTHPRCQGTEGVLGSGRPWCSLRAWLKSSLRGALQVSLAFVQRGKKCSPKLWRQSMAIGVSDRLATTSSSKPGLGISVARML